MEETILPGLGKRVTFHHLSDGNAIAVVLFEDGRKEIHINPDHPKPVVVKLEGDEARVVGQAIFSEWRPKTLIDHISRTFQGGMALDQFSITDASPIAGHTIMDTRLRSESGALIIAVVKGGTTQYNPPPTVAIQPGDVIVLIGDEDQLHKARRIITGAA